MIGKKIGKKVYVHVSCADKLPADMVRTIDLALYAMIKNGTTLPDDENLVVKIDQSTGVVSLIETIGWTMLHEPFVSKSHTVFPNGKVTTRIFNACASNSMFQPVYHHKWMFVCDDYTGFDVVESKRRSNWWQNHPVVLERMQKDPHFKSKIGIAPVWYELLSEMEKRDGVKSGDYSDPNHRY